MPLLNHQLLSFCFGGRRCALGVSLENFLPSLPDQKKYSTSKKYSLLKTKTFFCNQYFFILLIYLFFLTCFFLDPSLAFELCIAAGFRIWWVRGYVLQFQRTGGSLRGRRSGFGLLDWLPGCDEFISIFQVNLFFLKIFLWSSIIVDVCIHVHAGFIHTSKHPLTGASIMYLTASCAL